MSPKKRFYREEHKGHEEGAPRPSHVTLGKGQDILAFRAKHNRFRL
jgi:hypothetical protein